VYLTTAQEMRDLDRYAIETIGIPGVVLMENAGKAVARSLTDRLPRPGTALVLAGTGNNGGDGFVAARHLAAAGWKAVVWLAGPEEKLTSDARVFFQVCRNLGIPVVRDAEERRGELIRRIEEADAIVDALLGTGIRGQVRPRALELIRLVNEHRRGAVVAVDVPSGADTDTGALLPEAIRADWTVTFAYPKWCHYLLPAADHCGEVIVADIGIPRSAAEHRPPAARVNDPSWWREWLLPRSRWSHKGTYGHLLVVGGSRGMLGAAVLAGLAGLRIGAGLSTVAVPAAQEPILAAKVTDALVWGWPDDGEGRFAEDSVRILPERIDRFTAAAVGPGLGRFPGEGAWLRELLETLPFPVVLDADGLNILAEHPDALRARRGETILTPHPGEMARLAGTTAAGVESSRHTLAREWAEKTGSVVVLKGTHTIIAFPDGTQMVNPTGTPAMAKAGSGDVLSGVIGGLLARGIPASVAAAMGVYLHGLAGELAVRTSEHSLLASEILSQLGAALSRLASDRARA
jgi:hydroxyethylthiazole kinase-like uncharacterized protein yjeF